MSVAGKTQNPPFGQEKRLQLSLLLTSLNPLIVAT